MSEELAVIGENGWRSADDPPDTDRAVQIAWDDMSTSPKCIGCFDSKSMLPDPGPRMWWAMWPSVHVATGQIGAWRERIKP